MSSQLIWEVVKNNNSFIRKGINGSIFSAEAGNLYNKNSYKFSGLANAKTIDIAADGEAVKLSLARAKTAKQPAKSKGVSSMKKNARRVLKAVGKQAASYRPDLKSAALARAAAVAKSIRTKKAAKKTA